MSLETPDKPPFSVRLKKEYIIILVVVALALIPSVYFYNQYKSAQSRLANPTQFAGEEAKRLVADVGKLMSLPSDETPTVATVNDKEKLKNQPFFAKSENGDKVLIYTTSKKAILYRPSIQKIIDVAPVNIGATPQASQSAQTTGTPTVPQFTFQLLNGTNVVGLTRTYEAELVSKVKSAKVTDKDNAKKNTYEKSLLIDVSGKNAANAAVIAKALNLELSALPDGESTPSADFLIILGTDRK